MPLDVSSIVLKLVKFDPEVISTNPLRTRTVMLEIQNDEPESIIVKWSGSSKKLKAKPEVAIIYSRTSMQFRLTLFALNLRHDDPRAYFSVRVAGVNDDYEGERFPSKKIWKNDRLWETHVTSHLHKRYIYVEYTGMLASGWWKKDDEGKPRVMWGVDIPEQEEEGGQEDQQSGSGSQESSHEEQ